ncbi:MAG: metal-binding protein ZinT [Christensenellaceae bacterium]|nr:metal-binding protein ZinT [Christensenellaceae bacterium]
MKKLTRIFSMAMALIVAFAVVSCATVDAQDAGVSLQDWDGKWTNMVSFYDHDDLKEVVELLAKDHEMSVEEFIKHEQEESVPFTQLVVDGENSTIGFVYEKEEEPKETYIFEYVKSYEFSHGGASVFWHEFKTESEIETPVLLLIEVHGEENMAHFHLRAGKDTESLLADEDWYPTFVGEDMPTTMVAEALEHHHHSHDQEEN